MGRPRIIIRPTPIIRKQAGQMRKLLGLWDNSKVGATNSLTDDKSNPEPKITDGRPTFLTKTEGINQRHITRRQIVLNRHFTEIISDVLANNLKKQLCDLGVNITSIETKAWNKGISVFYSTNREYEEPIHKELNALITLLRAAISERQLIGRTPMISFVYDQVAELERNLESALTVTRKDDLEQDTSVVKSTSNTLKQSPTGGLEQKESSLNVKSFSAPADMSNMMLGLNYPTLYDEVSRKLERGRGQSSRMFSNDTIMPLKSFVNLPPMNDNDSEDPMQRILRMQKFLVSQRKKNEFQSRLRRKKELLARDDYKWDWPDEEQCDS